MCVCVCVCVCVCARVCERARVLMWNLRDNIIYVTLTAWQNNLPVPRRTFGFLQSAYKYGMCWKFLYIRTADVIILEYATWEVQEAYLYSSSS